MVDSRVAACAFQLQNGGKLPTHSGPELLACLFFVPRTEVPSAMQGLIAWEGSGSEALPLC